MKIIPIYGIQVNTPADNIKPIAYRVISNSNTKFSIFQGSYEDCKKYLEQMQNDKNP